MATSMVQQQNKHIPFTELVTLHQQAVYGYLLRFTRDPHDAQDLFQETFLRAYRAYAGLQSKQNKKNERDEMNYRAWLMRIAIDLSKNYARDRRRRGQVVVTAEPEDVESNASPQGNGADVEETVSDRSRAGGRDVEDPCSPPPGCSRRLLILR